MIEFPTVLMDAGSLEVLDEFRAYVRPVQNPTLTPFCTALTGIQQVRTASHVARRVASTACTGTSSTSLAVITHRTYITRNPSFPLVRPRVPRASLSGEPVSRVTVRV